MLTTNNISSHTIINEEMLFGGNKVSAYVSAEGLITNIEPIRLGNERQDDCCNLIMSVRTENRNVINFIVDINTYFIDNENMKKGDTAIFFYDSSLITPMIYPPQFRAVVAAKQIKNRFIKVGKFNQNLVSSDGSIRLNITPSTRIILINGQTFLCDIPNRNVAVVYTASSRSFPAVVNPSQIIVLCR